MLARLPVPLATAAWMAIGVGEVAGGEAEHVARLWIQASDGAVRHRELVQPSKDSLIALGGDAIPHLLPYLHTEDARERHAITDIFKGIGSVAVPALTSELGSGGEYHTLNTLNALGKIGDSVATPAILPYLHDTIASVRSKAAEAVGKTGGHAAETALLGSLRDKDESVRKSVVVGLGRLAQRLSADSLVDALDDSWYGVRYAAAAALVAIDSGEVAIATLEQLAGRRLALVLHALSGVRTPEITTVAWTYSEHPDPSVRAEAAHLLVDRVSGDHDGERLEARLASETDPVARYYYHLALSRLAP
jgi:HEAT repeat protein